jgi:hypothetical protein
MLFCPSLFPGSQRRLNGWQDGIRQLVRRGFLFMTPLQCCPGYGPADHGRLQLGAIDSAISQPLQQKLTDGGLYLGLNHGFKLPLMFLTAGGNLRQEVAGREDQLPQSRLTDPFVARHPSGDEFPDSCVGHGFQQGKFIGEMIVKSGPVKRGTFGNVLHRDKVEGLFREQALKGLKKHLPGASDARIDLHWLDGHAEKVAFDNLSVYGCITNSCSFNV